MNTTRLAAVAALSIAFLTGHASAQGSGNVTVYGLFDAAVRQASNANATRDSLRTMEDGIFTGSRLGFRGREDLGGGLSAVFTLELPRLSDQTSALLGPANG